MFRVVTILVIFWLLNATLGDASARACATLYEEVFYQGRSYSLSDRDSHQYLSYLNFAPVSVRVARGCSLRIFDNYGYERTLRMSYVKLLWSSYGVLDKACCECGGCDSAEANLGSSCARLYELDNCGRCNSYWLDLQDGDEARNFQILTNTISSLAVRSGCTVTVYSECEFQGWRYNLTASTNRLDDRWLRQISSAKCGCGPGAQRPPVTALPVTSTGLPLIPTTPNYNVPRNSSSPPTLLPTMPGLKGTIQTTPIENMPSSATTTNSATPTGTTTNSAVTQVDYEYIY